VTRRRLVFHPQVEDDLDAIVAYYAALDPSLPGRATIASRAEA